MLSGQIDEQGIVLQYLVVGGRHGHDCLRLECVILQHPTDGHDRAFQDRISGESHLKISEIGGIFAAYCEGRVNARDFVKAGHCWRNLAEQNTNQMRYYRTAKS